MVALMANGTSGDVNNINFLHPRPPKQAYEQMRFVANDLAAKAQARRGEGPLSGSGDAGCSLSGTGDCHAASQRRAIGMGRAKCWPRGPRTRFPYIYAQRFQNLANGAAAVPGAAASLAYRRRFASAACPTRSSARSVLEFRKRSPVQPAFLVSLAHGYFDYLPTPKQHAWGGYETWLATNRLEPKASEKMLNILLEMAAGVRDAK